MSKALGIINFAGNHINVNGPQHYRPVGAITFLGRYRVIDFPISNFSNSGISDIHVYVRRKPRSLVEHLGAGRHYNINSKRGKLRVLFAEDDMDSLYSNEISAYIDNMEIIEGSRNEYVIIAPSYMVFRQDYNQLLNQHIASGAAISLLYHSTDEAQEKYLTCQTLELNRQKGVTGIVPNHGNAKSRNIFMDTYVMKRELFIELVKRTHQTSAMYTLTDAVNLACQETDVRGLPHRGFFASITDYKSYYDANLSLIDFKTADNLFDSDWPIYTKTNDSCPTKYCEGANVKSSTISNGCLIEGTVENSVLGRGCVIKKGAVIRNSVLLQDVLVESDITVENTVVDKHTRLIHTKEIKGTPEKPGYVRRSDTL